MVFSSTIFLFIFLPLVLLGYYLLKVEYRNTFLLLVSLFFYAWGEPTYLGVMLLSIFVNYISGLLIDRLRINNKEFEAKLSMIGSVVLNLGMLFYFKYFDFFIEIINSTFKTNYKILNISLPIGISFFTFQGLSYVLDVYMKNSKVQKNICKLGLYVSLFPQLIAGPIVRYLDVNEQIDSRICSLEKFTSGIKRFTVGLGKKVIIANQMGLVADSIFNAPVGQHSISIAWIGIICYSFQIYYDFSGYSDMAIGLGRMFGFEFLENFNYPYISRSITEFWRRWHKSLSTWFRDYLYIPLGGNRTGNVYINLIIVFFVTGLWHGAAWNFIVWGLWYGIFLIIERIIGKREYKIEIPEYAKWIYTMLIVIIGWVFFRASTLTYALEYISLMFNPIQHNEFGYTPSYYLNLKTIIILILAVIGSAPTLRTIKKNILNKIKYKNLMESITNAYVLLVLFISIIFTMTSTYNPFIYFRF